MNPTTNTPLIPSSTFRCHFKNRDELLEKLCERIYGGSPHYADDEKPAAATFPASTYIAQEILAEIHAKLEECKGVLEQWPNSCDRSH